MAPDPLNEAAAEVLRHYAPLWSISPQPLGNWGGFSGARLWRIDGVLCLRAWPTGFSSQRLAFIHHCMTHAHAAGLMFVPRLFRTTAGTTAVEHGGRLWELQQWVRGMADYHIVPAPGKLRAALAALAQLHVCWQSLVPAASGPCPALIRRLDVVSKWRELVQQGWRPQLRPDDPARQAVERAWGLLPGRMDAVPDLLRRWVNRIWPLQPCLCDVWHDHVLFYFNHVTGIIDYGAMKIDHPAVDVARLLGSLVADGADGWAAGLAAYREVRPFSADEEELARALDVTGVIAGTAVWLRWLYRDRKEFEDRAAAGRRLASLVTRLERRL